jgi:TorA maturation chaperone TorD
MNGRAFILIQFDMDTLTKQSHLLEIRSTLYGTVSALFSDPESEKFAMLFTPKIQGCVLDACFQIEELEHSEETALSKSFQMLMSKLDEKKKENIRNEFVNVFGHTLSKQIAPYALEHLKNSDVFFRTQKLADLNGFYKAFGMEVESIERADHISTQTEFLSFLLLKELLALTNELDEEKEICETAFIDFNQNHFSDWAKMFAGNLADKINGDFYNLSGKFLHTFIDCEKISKATINKKYVKD